MLRVLIISLMLTVANVSSGVAFSPVHGASDGHQSIDRPTDKPVIADLLRVTSPLTPKAASERVLAPRLPENVLNALAPDHAVTAPVEAKSYTTALFKLKKSMKADKVHKASHQPAKKPRKQRAKSISLRPFPPTAVVGVYR